MRVWPLCGRVSKTRSILSLSCIGLCCLIQGTARSSPSKHQTDLSSLAYPLNSLVPITAPGCSSQNMLVSSPRAVAPPRGQTSRHQAQGHQNPQSVLFPMVLAILHCHRKHKLGAARRNSVDSLKTIITRRVGPSVARAQVGPVISFLMVFPKKCA